MPANSWRRQELFGSPTFSPHFVHFRIQPGYGQEIVISVSEPPC